MSDDLKTLDGTLEAVWRRLEDGVKDPEAIARNVALATARTDEGGAVRIVVLRRADRAAGALTFYTHRASSKVGELAKSPKCEALIWDAEHSFQIRLRLTAEVHDGPDNIWQSFGRHTRENYAGTPLPGSPLGKAGDFAPTPDAGQFMMIVARIAAIETLYLGRGLQRRALFSHTGAQWLAP